VPASINFGDIPPDQARKLGIRKPKAGGFSKENVRSWALRVLAELASLTQDQRRRVLDQAQRVNRL
jgi:hypothetical protein